MTFKSSFSDLRIMASIRKKSADALKVAMTNAKADLTDRLDSGISKTGKLFKYAKSTQKKKGKESPVDWIDSGQLRRAIDFKIEKNKTNLRGMLGYRNASFQGVSNKTKLDYLTQRFKGLWALSKSEIRELINTYKREFKR
jgi:hypothetical protein